MKKKLVVVMLVVAVALLATSAVYAAPPAAAEQTITDIVVSNGDFSTLATAVSAAGLAGVLDGPGPFTVFAPTNAAFAALPPELITALLADPSGALTDILLYHVVAGEFFAADVVGLSAVPTVLGERAALERRADGLYIAGAKIIVTDIRASNGVIHVINAVMVPPSLLANKPVDIRPATISFTDKGAEIVADWPAFSFPAGSNGAYRVTLRQYLPLHLNGTYTEVKIGFHFASAGTNFVFGNLTNLKAGYPTYVVIEPYTYELALSAATGAYEYKYTRVSGAPAQWSAMFVR